MRSLFRTNLLILVLLNTGNLFNYLFQIVAARAMSPADYGVFNAINSMTAVLIAPAAVLPMLFARFTVTLNSNSQGQVKTFIVTSFRYLCMVALGGIVLSLVSLPVLQRFLHVQESLPFLIMLANLFLALLLPSFHGVLQGLRRYLAYGMATTGAMLTRLLVGAVLLFPLAAGVNGALFAWTCGLLLEISVSYWLLRKMVRLPPEPLPQGLFKDMARFALPVFVVTTLVLALSNIDIVLARHYCSPDEAGLYATAAILGRVAFFLPGVLIHVFFPEIATAKEEEADDSHILWGTFGFTLLLGGGVALACFVYGAEIISLLFSAKYQAAASLLSIISLAMAMLGLCNLLFSYRLARHEFGFIKWLVVGVVIMVTLALLFHDSAMEIALSLLASVTFLLLSMLGQTLALHIKTMRVSSCLN